MNLEKLTRDQLLEGRNFIDHYELPGEGVISLRPVTSGEWVKMSVSRVKAVESVIKGSQNKARPNRPAPQGDVSMTVMMESDFELKVCLIKTCLLEPKLTEEEVRALKPGTLDLINKRIRIISGIDEQAAGEAVSFRDK